MLGFLYNYQKGCIVPLNITGVSDAGQVVVCVSSVRCSQLRYGLAPNLSTRCAHVSFHNNTICFRLRSLVITLRSQASCLKGQFVRSLSIEAAMAFKPNAVSGALLSV